MSDDPTRADDAVEREEEMREHEEEARRRDPDERAQHGGGRSATGLPDPGEAEPAPPGNTPGGTLTGS